MDKWANRVPDASESLYTIVMDVCEGASQYSEVINTFKKMIDRNIKGTKSAFSFVIRACGKLMDSILAIQIINEYRSLESRFCYFQCSSMHTRFTVKIVGGTFTLPLILLIKGCPRIIKLHNV
jgi:pentatricopeptide repeat protein